MKVYARDLKELPDDNGFRLRGLEMTRLETFIDAAFAFATTLLIISVGEIPQSYRQLLLALKEIPSCLSSFFIIMLFWKGHRTWSRRYGLEDKQTILLSISLIFVLLVYVYPLRMMFAALFSWISNGWLPSRFSISSFDELIGLFIIYGIGLAAMAGIMALLYLHAKALRSHLSLNRLEVIRTDTEIVTYLIVSLTGIISVLFAWLVPPQLNILAGFIYITLPVTELLIEGHFRKKEKKLKLVK